jgi:competence protein ComEC
MNPHRASFSRQPLAQLAIAFSIGICVTNYFPTRLLPWLIAGAVCSATALAATLTRKLPLAGAVLLLATGCVGAALAIQAGRDLPHDRLKEFFGQQVILSGVVGAPVEVGKDRLYLTLNVERVDVDGSTRAQSGVVLLVAQVKGLDYGALQLRYGARIRVAARLNRGDEFRNPGVSPLSEYLERKGYDATGYVKSAGEITRLEDELATGFASWPASGLLSLLYLWREQLQQEFKSSFDAETASVLDASLLGNRYNLSHETSERFREGGTFHVLVISGLHISVIGGVVFLLMKRLTRRRWLQFIVPALVVWAYSFAVGAEASVVRAALMFTFAGFALVIFRESSSLNALGAATLVLLVRSPKEIFDPSFQLTFLSVLAIVVIAWPLLQTCAAIGAWYPKRETPRPPTCSRGLRAFCEMLFWSERAWAKEIARSAHRYRLFKAPLAARLERYRIQWLLRYVFSALVVSGAVQLVLLPMMIVYFHRLSVASLVLNIVVSVLLAVLTAVALLALLVSQLSAMIAAPLIQLAETINWLMIHSVDSFSRLHLASIRVPEYSGWGALVYVLYFIPLLALVFNKRCIRPAVLTQLLLVLVVTFHPLSNRTENAKLRIDFLDVGQGDSALITMPDGRTLLVDGGGRPEAADLRGSKPDRRSIGEAVVSEYLWWRGLDTVDYVLATHADADHIDGLNDVLRNFTVAAALVARSPANDPEYVKFAQTLSTTSTQLTTIQAGDMIRFGDVEFNVLWPPAAVQPNEPSRNNDSIVLQVSYGKRKILLTGDIEKGAERALLQSAIELHADVVKVPHHGSKSSSTPAFVTATQPRFAIVSVGQHSMFGHPHREVVERWQASGARVLTTGQCGTITATTDGTELNVTGMQSRISSESLCLLAR